MSANEEIVSDITEAAVLRAPSRADADGNRAFKSRKMAAMVAQLSPIFRAPSEQQVISPEDIDDERYWHYFPCTGSGVYVHKALFEKGIIAIAPPRIIKQHTLSSCLAITKPNKDRNDVVIQGKVSTKNFIFGNPYALNQYEFATMSSIQQNRLSRIKNACSIINSAIDIKNGEDNLIPTVFENNNGEVYLSVKIADNSSMYIYPWQNTVQSKFKDSVNNTCSVFHTAQCMFGTSLMAKYSELDNSFPMIKHDIEFTGDQVIDEIIYDNQSRSPYEEMEYNELKKLIAFINQYASSNKNNELLIHLPYYDYVLFGVELFLRGRITIEALGDFFCCIFEKREKFTEEVKSLCKPHENITVKIESPFDNLFGKVEDIIKRAASNAKVKSEASKGPKYMAQYRQSLAEVILNALNIDLKMPDNKEITGDKKKENEKKLVQDCIQKLTQNSYNERHQELWLDFCAISQDDVDRVARNHKNSHSPQKTKENTCTIEDLFRVANILMLAGVTTSNDKKACCILPKSEQPIPKHYSRGDRELLNAGRIRRMKLDENSHEHYKTTVNLTTLDPIVAYARNIRGNLFYLNDGCLSAVGALVDQKILQAAAENTYRYANGLKGISLDDFLQGKYTPADQHTNGYRAPSPT